MALFSTMALAADEEDYSAWSHSALIRFNTAPATSVPAGANIPGNIQKFPLLVRIGASMPIAGAIFSQSLAEGADLRFSDPDGTHLDFQIDRYDAAAGKAEIWVLVPQIDGNSDKDYIRIHWGKAGAAWLSDGSKVFRRDLSYEGVWHLGEASMQTRSNSVGAFNHAEPKNYTGNERVAGIIGMADSLAGSASVWDGQFGWGTPWGGGAGTGLAPYLDVGAGFADVAGKGFTFSLWAYASEAGDYARFFDFGSGEAMDNILLARLGSTDNLYFEAYNVSSATVKLSATHGMDEKKWMFLAVTQSGGNVSLYKNGVLLQSYKTDLLPRNVTRTRNYLGRSNWSTDAYFKGKLDDPQISLTARSADWIRLNYENQNPASLKLITWASPPVIKLAITAQPVSPTRAEGDSVSLGLSAISSETIKYAWFKNRSVIAGANGPTLPFPSLSLQDAGVYHCVAMDKTDTVTSRDAEIKVREDYSTWSHAQRIFFNTTAAGAAVASDVDDFPLLVRFDAERLDFSQAGAGGKDLRFSDADGSPIPFQIERWNAASSQAEVWVRVPRIDGNSDRDFISFHWGKPTAVSASRGDSVFSASNGFLSAYNLNETTGDETAGDALDAVSPPANGSNNQATRGIAGLIGNAYRFNGVNTYVTLPKTRLSGVPAFTVSLWAKETAPFSGINSAPRTTLLGMSTAGASSGDFAIRSESRNLGAASGFKAGGDSVLATSIPLTDDWHHIAVTYDGAEFRLYDAGAVAGAHPATGIKVAGLDLSIGALHTDAGTWTEGFYGDIDAVQISGQARGPAWINLAYQSQRGDGNLLSFGVPMENPPPAPVAEPGAGRYPGSISVSLTCAADNSAIFYTLDGSAPDTLVKGSTRLAGAPITVDKSMILKAKAYRSGKAGTVLTAAYDIRGAPGADGDSLFAGGRLSLDHTHSIVYPSQDSRAPVLVSLESGSNLAPQGFDKLGPIFTVAPTDSQAAFPGLLITGDSGSGVQLYRREADVNRWMPPKDGMLWVPTAGSYFWGRDIQPPRIRYGGSDPHGEDSVHVFFAIEDNVANLRCRLHVHGGSGGGTLWRHVASGEIAAFRLRLPDSPETPMELGVDATDESLLSNFPAGTGRRFALERGLASVSAPIGLQSGARWKLIGMPMVPQAPLTLGKLASESGSGALVSVFWRTRSGAEGDYEWYGAKDSLPAGKAFWLASEKAAPELVFPSSRSVPSDSDGLFPIPLKNGWNLITCPSFRAIAWPVSKKDGESYLRSPLKGLRGFDGNGYTHVDSLRPWEGYYVWYEGGDTVVRVGPGAPRAGETAKRAARGSGVTGGQARISAGAPQASAGLPPAASGMRLGFRAGTGSPASETADRPDGRALPLALTEKLELGAAGFARMGLGIEDERLPPSLSRENGTWLSREGRRLSTDYLAWNPEAVLSWTVVAQGKPQGYSLRLETSELPEGHQAWAVSPARRIKYRLLPGTDIPLAGDDTLLVHAGPPEALAKMGDLLLGRETAGAFAFILRADAGGLDLAITLPTTARVDVKVWTVDGSRAGGLNGILAAPGTHTWSWSALAPGYPAPAPGVYLLEIRAKASDWSAHRVEKFGILR